MAGGHKLRVALVGCGRMGTFTSDKLRRGLPVGWLPLCHAEAIQAHPDLELCALCDTDRQALERAGAALGVEALYRDYGEMISRERPDILSIATRTPGRCQIIRFAAEQGVRGIHSEKPLAQSLGECLATLEVLERRRVAFTYGTYRRYMAIYRQARDFVGQGKIGELREVVVEMGPTMLLWNHPHSVDLILFYAQGRRPELVWADCELDPQACQGYTLVDQDPVVRQGYIRFEDGLIGSLSSIKGLNLRLGGSLGNLAVEGDGSRLVLYQPHYPETGYLLNRRGYLPDPTAPSGTQVAFQELAAAVQGQGDTSLGLEEVEWNTRLLLSLAYSALKGMVPVDPAELPTDFRVTGRFGQLFA